MPENIEKLFIFFKETTLPLVNQSSRQYLTLRFERHELLELEQEVIKSFHNSEVETNSFYQQVLQNHKSPVVWQKTLDIEHISKNTHKTLRIAGDDIHKRMEGVLDGISSKNYENNLALVHIGVAFSVGLNRYFFTIPLKTPSNYVHADFNKEEFKQRYDRDINKAIKLLNILTHKNASNHDSINLAHSEEAFFEYLECSHFFSSYF